VQKSNNSPWGKDNSFTIGSANWRAPYGSNFTGKSSTKSPDLSQENDSSEKGSKKSILGRREIKDHGKENLAWACCVHPN
jgi:hypothetical protein